MFSDNSLLKLLIKSNQNSEKAWDGQKQIWPESYIK